MPNMSFTELSVTPQPSLPLARKFPHNEDEIPKLGPLELFQSQLQDAGNTEAKVDAFKRLRVVAFALPKDQVLGQLVPYLQTLVLTTTLEDEILLLMGKQLELLVPSLLGKPQEMLSIFPLLERLASMEETVVRDQAVIAVNHVAVELLKASGGKSLDASVSTQLVSLAKRLAAAEWFTAKVSVCGMVHQLYAVTGHAELPYLYKELATDETPMVRRAAAQHLGKLLKELSQNPSPQSKSSVNDLTTVLQTLCRDEQDSVRALAVASLADVGTQFTKTPEWTKEYFLPLVKDGCTDMSWRVRNSLAKKFAPVAEHLGFKDNSKYQGDLVLVLQCYASLLGDVEPEVRAAAVVHFAAIVNLAGSTLFQQHLLSLLPGLADDVVMEVRSKCALSLMECAQSGTLEDNLVVSQFGPLLESLLQDEFQEVQLQVLQNLHKISRLLQGLAGVVTSILGMSKATNWRVRQGVAQLLPHLIEARGTDFFLNVLLEPCWLVLLTDPVAHVRLACVDGMKVLVETTRGTDWMMQHLIPQHNRIYNHADGGSYLMRITILQGHAVTAVASVGDSDMALFTEVVSQLTKALSDKVPNVRMVAAKGLESAMRAVGEKGTNQHSSMIDSKVKPTLQKTLQEDSDWDVRHACQMALEAK